MGDRSWRELERAWRTTPGDQDLLRRTIAARRRVGVGVPGAMRTALVQPPRTFTSQRCPLRVWAELPSGEVTLVGRSTPRLPPVQLPTHRAWWVQLHLDGFDAQVTTAELIEAVIDEAITGVALSHDQASDDALARLGGSTDLRLLHVFQPWNQSDAGLKSLAGLPLERLRLEDSREITDAGIEHLSSLDLARLEVWHCPQVTLSGTATLQRAQPHCEIQQQTPTLPRAGDRFGPYDILSEMGRGDACVVYHASQRSLSRSVALKVLPLGSAPEERARFERGMEYLAKFRHPNLPAVFEVGSHRGNGYYTLQPSACSLGDRIATGPIEAEEARRIARDIARALTVVHADGLLHRHVKPQNVLVDPDRARLTGLSLAVRQDGRMDGPGGSPAWMAPEQASGDGTRLDARCDLYGVGACLYAMLTGEPPFHGQTAINVIYALLTRDPISPSVLRPDVDPALASLALRCLAKDPADRPRTASELLDLLS